MLVPVCAMLNQMIVAAEYLAMYGAMKYADVCVHIHMRKIVKPSIIMSGGRISVLACVKTDMKIQTIRALARRFNPCRNG